MRSDGDAQRPDRVLVMSEGQPHPGAPAAPLAATARWIAAARAGETRRPDRLLEDPWAAALAGPEGEDWLGARAGQPGAGGDDHPGPVLR